MNVASLRRRNEYVATVMSAPGRGGTQSSQDMSCYGIAPLPPYVIATCYVTQAEPHNDNAGESSHARYVEYGYVRGERLLFTAAAMRAAQLAYVVAIYATL